MEIIIIIIIMIITIIIIIIIIMLIIMLIMLIIIIINGHCGRTSMDCSLLRECGRFRPPESGVLASASNPKATPVRVTTKW